MTEKAEDTETKAMSAKQSRVADMNLLARRIWDGQSISLPLITRVGRIKSALAAKGYEKDISSLSLPATGFKKFLK